MKNFEVGKEGEREREKAPRVRAPSTDSINLNERLVVRFRAPSTDSINLNERLVVVSLT